MELKNQRQLFILLIIIAAVAVIACIIGAVALSMNKSPEVITIQTGKGDSSDSGPSAPGVGGIGTEVQIGEDGEIYIHRVYSISLGHDYGAYEYINEGGYLTGFNYDLVTEVCAAAGIDCRTIWDRTSNCWDSQEGQHSYAGKGILARYYDGCLGYFQTVDRSHSLDFSMPYGKKPKSYFYVKPGESFDSGDLNGKTIGFLDGWASDEKCVARQKDVKNNFLTESNIKYAPDAATLKAKILSGEVDAGFTSEETMSGFIKDGSLSQSSDSFNCVLEGDSLMTRKDSDFNQLWNKGFLKIKANGKFKEICDRAAKVHGAKGDIMCIES